jgi:uncharacterized membrane protein
MESTDRLETAPAGSSLLIPICTIDATAPWRWLNKGWADIRRAPGPSLAYGAMFALMGWAIYAVFQARFELTSALTAGFLLLGPFLATGLYDISRRLQRGERVDFASTLTAWRSNLAAISFFTLVLMIILLVWARASLVIFALFFSSGMPTLKGFIVQVVSFEHLDFLLTYFAIGAVFAAIVFAVSVVSVPMMLDRGTDTVVAMLTSVRALLTHPLPLLMWSALIVIIVGLGFATFFVGLVVAVPLIGHATWHAYQDLVAAEDLPLAMVDRPSAGPNDM